MKGFGPAVAAASTPRNIDFFNIRFFDLIPLPTQGLEAESVGQSQGLQACRGCLSRRQGTGGAHASAAGKAASEAAILRVELRAGPKAD